MKTFVIIIIWSIAYTAYGFGVPADSKTDKEAIEQVVFGFIEHCMNNFNVEGVETYFHPDFMGLSMENDTIRIATRSTFTDYIVRMKNNKSPDARQRRSAKILMCESIRDIGLVEFEIYRGNEMLGTDYIVLLKSAGVWKFVRSITHYNSQLNCFDPELESEKIKTVIEESLVDAAGNYWNIDKWKEGFHPEFTGLTSVGTELEKDTYADWEGFINAMKLREPEGHGELITGKVTRVDVLGHMGIAELKIYYGTRLNETAYIFLFNFTNGWKIMSKVGLNVKK